MNSSIVLDENGRPVISYYDVTNRDLKIAYCNDLACAAPTIEIVDDTGFAGIFSSLAIDENGLAVIAYYEAINADLKIAFCNDPVCSAPTIKLLDAIDDSGQYASLAIKSGRIFVSYFRDTGSADELKIARCDDAVCDSVTVLHLIEMTDANYSSMAMDDNDQAFISFWDGDQGDLIVAACRIDPIIGCKGATFTRVDRFHVTGLYTAITLDQEGRPMVSYYDQEEEALNLAKCPLCRVPVRTHIGPVSSEDSISLALTEVGYPVMTYQDSTDNNFYLVFCQDTICAATTKTSIGTNLHINPSLQLQEDGRPAVAYYHASSNELKYTVCNNYDCSNQTTNVIAFDGYDPSLRFNSLGLPVIAYYNASGNNLNLARCNDIACSAPLLTIVDDAASVGSYTSMALTPDDYPVISYYDTTNDTIKFAICDDPGCTNPAIDETQATYGPYNALALNEDASKVYIAFYNSSGPALNFLSCSIPCDSWGISALDNTTAAVGWDISIVVDQNGRPMVSYYDVENGALRLASCYYGNCSLGASLSVIDTLGGDNGRFSQMVLNGRGEPVIAHANLTMPSARIIVYDAEPTLYQVYAPTVMGQ
jgi:hypothetical protein